jgi:hypothetical protein
MSMKTGTLSVAALLAVSLGAMNALAANRHSATTAAHRLRNTYSWRGTPYFVHNTPMRLYDYNHPNESGPAYFIPGRGILNEPCDLPSSTCSNEYRDIE